MVITSKNHYRAKSISSLAVICLLYFLLPAASHADIPGRPDNSGPILVTIKPLYSLVAQLTDGIDTPVLLMKQLQSPHHYNMRPSERHLLATARMIVWVGPQMETSFAGIIQQHEEPTVVTAIEADGLQLLNKRKKHSNDKDQHHQADAVDADKIDPHIWLSSHNAAAISRQVCARLIAQDPANAELYRNNLQRLLTKIQHTADSINAILKNRKQPFITFHDAFQYFEDENRLNYADSINFDEETGTSLKHLRRIKTSMEKHNIQCLVYQQPKPAIIDSLTRHTTVKAIALDPLGLEVSDDKEAWFELMKELATDFEQCLTPS